MKVTKNNRHLYQVEWMEIQGETFYGYAQKVSVKLKNMGIEVPEKKIHNVVSGTVKDFQILRAVKEVCLENAGTAHLSEAKDFKLEKNLN